MTKSCVLTTTDQFAPETMETVGMTTTSSCPPPKRQTWTYLGPSVDVGGQWIGNYGFTLGGSIGAHYRFVAEGNLDESILPFGWRRGVPYIA